MSSEPPQADLIVIGAGINGAAIAREAALLGLAVVVLDKGDVGAGTSASSTRLIHGGLRYLEHGELNLVYESLSERERLLRTAPHLVTPLEFFLPIYKRGRRKRWQIRLGLALYDLLSIGSSLPGHSVLSATELGRRLPGLERRKLVGGASYFDAQVNFPERLVLELVQDAVAKSAVLMTYTEVERIIVADGSVRGVHWRDGAGREGDVLSDCVVNAAGPWVDRVNQGLGIGRLIGGTRGSHLIVPPFAGAPDAAVYSEAALDGRPFFVVPWNGLYLIGTTDERFDGEPENAAISDAERDYLLEETLRIFPSATSLARQILYTQAGVRPLPYVQRGAEGAITRRHLIRHHREARGLYSIIGGKLTTHRALAVDFMRRLRRRKRSVPRHSETASRMLPGGLSPADRDELLRELSEAVGADQARRLWGIYGSRAHAIAELTRRSPELGAAVAPRSRLLAAELVHAIESEWATNLIDILQRRCMAGLDADFGRRSAGPAAEWLSRLGYWDGSRAAVEREAYDRFAALHRARAESS